MDTDLIGGIGGAARGSQAIHEDTELVVARASLQGI